MELVEFTDYGSKNILAIMPECLGILYFYFVSTVWRGHRDRNNLTSTPCF